MVKQEDHKGNTPLHYATSDPSCSAVALQFLDSLKDHADEAVFRHGSIRHPPVWWARYSCHL